MARSTPKRAVEGRQSVKRDNCPPENNGTNSECKTLECPASTSASTSTSTNTYNSNSTNAKKMGPTASAK